MSSLTQPRLQTPSDSQSYSNSIDSISTHMPSDAARCHKLQNIQVQHMCQSFYFLWQSCGVKDDPHQFGYNAPGFGEREDHRTRCTNTSCGTPDISCRLCCILSSEHPVHQLPKLAQVLYCELCAKAGSICTSTSLLIETCHNLLMVLYSEYNHNLQVIQQLSRKVSSGNARFDMCFCCRLQVHSQA